MEARAHHPHAESVAVVTSFIVTSSRGIYRERVDAHIFGDWVAHRIPDFDDSSLHAKNGWRVAHRHSGAAIASLVDDLTEGDAIAIAKALNRQLPDFPKVTAEDARRGDVMPPWGYIVQAVVAETLERR